MYCLDRSRVEILEVWAVDCRGCEITDVAVDLQGPSRRESSETKQALGGRLCGDRPHAASALCCPRVEQDGELGTDKEWRVWKRGRFRWWGTAEPLRIREARF